MNALLQAKNAYRRETQPIRTDRGTEYEVFARVTHRLKSAPKAGFGELAAAIHDNRRLWTVLASDVAGEGNGFPESLRARILYLADFTRQHSGKVLRRQASADALIEINTAVMRGLREGGGNP